MKKIPHIFYGGSFYPPHRGHTEIVKNALAKNREALLHIIPTKQNPLKNSRGASMDLMNAWMDDLSNELSVQDFSRCILDVSELESPEKNSFTFDTLKDK